MNRSVFVKKGRGYLAAISPHKMLEEALAELSRFCEWQYDEKGFYNSECGHNPSSIEGDYCPYCGGIVGER